MNGILRRPLERLRDRLDLVLAEPAAAAPEPARCRHPTDQRLDARRMGHPHAFVCGLCLEEVD